MDSGRRIGGPGAAPQLLLGQGAAAAPGLLPRQRHDHGDGAQPEPGRRDEHGDPDVEAVLVRHPEPADLGVDEADEEDEQQDDAAEVAHSPAQARDRPDPVLGRQMGQQAVVIDAGQLEEDIAQPQQDDAQPQVARLGQDEEEHGADHDDGGRVDAEPEDGAPRPVGPLPGDGGQERDEDAGDGQAH